MEIFQDSMLELITQTSTNLPPDVRQAMGGAVSQERPSTQASQALAVIATNIDMASDGQGPICQDTGMPTFEIKTPVRINQIKMKAAIRAAIAEATRRGKLRPNSVDSLTGMNSGDNLGPGTPILHFDQWENESEIEVKLLLKGGGCENKNIQYSVPCELPHLGRASRDLDGVRKCIMHAVWQAQGQGCSAGAIGVCIGGDRTSGYQHAKEQLFRTLDDTNPDDKLAALEDYVMNAANTLNIGTMGFGGGVTLIGCKIGALNRLPASFFVSVAYDCWAFRRLGVILNASSGVIERWLYRVARKHAGHQEIGWQFTMRQLYEKSGASSRFSDFALDVRRVVDENSLPEYTLNVRKNDEGDEIVSFVRRDQLSVNDSRFETPRHRRRRLAQGITSKSFKFNDPAM